MGDFSKNPCRHHLFEVFGLDKSEIDLRAILSATQAARDRLRYGRIVARDGTELELSEAEINALDKVLLNPLERLKAEQLVHQTHEFSADRELALCVEGLAAAAGDPLPALVAEAQGQALLALLKVSALLPPPSFLADDLPWPPEPKAYDLRRESLKESILRDQ